MCGLLSYTNGMSARPLPLKLLAVPTAHGVWLTARLGPLPFRLLASTLSVFRDCSRSSSTKLNRRMRTRMSGGVAGESG